MWLRGLQEAAAGADRLGRCQPFSETRPTSEELNGLREQFGTSEVYAFAPFCLLAFLFLAVTQARFVTLRAHPADLLFMVALGAVLCFTNLFVSALFYDSSQGSLTLTAFNSFCYGTAFLSIVGSSLIYLYNALFYLYYLDSMRRAVRSQPPRHKGLVHSAAIGTSLLIVIVAYGTGNVGLSVAGYCYIRSTFLTPFFQVALTLFFFVGSLTAFLLTHRQFPSIPELSSLRNQVFFYNLFYIALFGVLVLLQVLSKLVITLKCMHGDIDEIGPYLKVGRVADLSLLLIIALVRALDPAVLSWAKSFCRRRPREQAPAQFQLILKASMTGDKNWLQSLQSQIKRQKAAALIHGLAFLFSNQQALGRSDLEEVAFRQQLQIKLTPEESSVALQAEGVKCPNSDFLVFSPRIFRFIRESMGVKVLRLGLGEQLVFEHSLQFQTGRKAVVVRAREAPRKQVKGLTKVQDRLLDYFCRYQNTTLLQVLVLMCSVKLDHLMAPPSYFLLRRDVDLPPEAVIASYCFKPLLNQKQEAEELGGVALRRGDRFTQVSAFLSKEGCIQVGDLPLRDRLFSDLNLLSSMDYYSYSLRVDIVDAELFRRLKGLEHVQALRLYRREGQRESWEDESEQLYSVQVLDCYKVSRKGDFWQDARKWSNETLGTQLETLAELYFRRFVEEIIDPLFGLRL